MGRHGVADRTVPEAERAARFEAPASPEPARSVAVRRRSRGRLVLGAFAMLTSAGIALVTVAGPYAGAIASPYYQEPVLADSDRLQRYEIDGGYVLVDLERDSFRAVVEATAPEPQPESAAGDAGGGGGYTVTPVGTAQAYAAQAVAKRGWAPSEFGCLVSLWSRESGWNSHAANPSGAYGIPQALPGSKMGPGWQDDYRVQISWGIGYIAGRYGSPCGAWGHSSSAGWY